MDPEIKVITFSAEAIKGLVAVCDAAKAEVVAQGYRSSDMARALEALCGEFWYEQYVTPARPTCGYVLSVEMDDGPLEQRCILGPHGSEREHHF